MRLVLPLLNSPTTTNMNKSSRCEINCRSSVRSLSRASLSIILSQMFDNSLFSRAKNARSSGVSIWLSVVASTGCDEVVVVVAVVAVAAAAGDDDVVDTAAGDDDVVDAGDAIVVAAAAVTTEGFEPAATVENNRWRGIRSSVGGVGLSARGAQRVDALATTACLSNVRSERFGNVVNRSISLRVATAKTQSRQSVGTKTILTIGSCDNDKQSTKQRRIANKKKLIKMNKFLLNKSHTEGIIFLFFFFSARTQVVFNAMFGSGPVSEMTSR